MQLKPRLDAAQTAQSSDSENEINHDEEPTLEENGEPLRAPESCRPTVNGKRAVPCPKKTSTPAKVLDDTAEVVNLISSLQSQQERSDSLQGQISGLLSREQRSATAAWGAWIGAMAANLHPSVLPRFYRASLDTVLSFAEESRRLQDPHAAQELGQMNFDIQPQQSCQQPPPPPQQQQLEQATFTTLVPLNHHQQQQQQQYFDDGARTAPMWDTMAPTAGQNVASVPTSQPPRPASTPASLNSSFQIPSIPDFSNLNTTPSPAGRQLDATFN